MSKLKQGTYTSIIFILQALPNTCIGIVLHFGRSSHNNKEFNMLQI